MSCIFIVNNTMNLFLLLNKSLSLVQFHWSSCHTAGSSKDWVVVRLERPNTEQASNLLDLSISPNKIAKIHGTYI